MSTNHYNPVRLTKGPQINYGAMMRQQPTPKEIQVQNNLDETSLESLGIKGTTEVTYKRDENGNLVMDANGKPVTIKKFTPTEVPAYFTRAIMVLAGHEPCYFEGCEEVVAGYKAELEVLERRQGGCRPCDRAKLQRKYAHKFRNALPPTEANKIEPPTIPPYTVTNVTTKETVQVPRRQIPYATIRREVPPELAKAFTLKASQRKLVVNSQVVPLDGTTQPDGQNTGTPAGS